MWAVICLIRIDVSSSSSSSQFSNKWFGFRDVIGLVWSKRFWGTLSNKWEMLMTFETALPFESYYNRNTMESTWNKWFFGAPQTPHFVLSEDLFLSEQKVPCTKLFYQRIVRLRMYHWILRTAHLHSVLFAHQTKPLRPQPDVTLWTDVHFTFQFESCVINYDWLWWTTFDT